MLIDNKFDNKCKNYELLFIECMKKKPVNDKCKLQFELWYKCINK